MKYDVQLVKTREMFCEESAIASFAKWKNRNYEMMYVGMCNFVFDYDRAVKEKKVGKFLDCGYSTEDIYRAVEKYHGIKVESKICEEGQIPSEIFSEYLKKEVLCTVSLPYSCCAWTEGGEDKDEDNFLMLVGFEKDYFYCINIHLNDPEVHTVSFKEINSVYQNNSEHFYQTYQIVVDEDKECSVDDFIRFIKNSDYYLKSNEKVGQMREFAESIETFFDLNEEIKDEPFRFYIPILINVTHIVRGRLLLAETLEYIYMLTNDPTAKKLAIEFRVLGAGWKEFRTMLDKMIVKISVSSKKQSNGQKKNLRLASCVKKIMDEEYQFIQSLCNNELQLLDEFVVRDDEGYKNITKDIIECRIEQYYNNSAFASCIENNENADLTGHNEFWVDENIATDGVKLYIGGYETYIRKNANCNCNDNVLCNSQEISLIRGKYKKLIITGCAEWGDGSGVIQVDYEGYSQKILMSMPDWYPYSLTDEICWSGKAVDYQGNLQERAIYSQVYTLDDSSDLVSLLLPDSINIHIFKILLLK